MITRVLNLILAFLASLLFVLPVATDPRPPDVGSVLRMLLPLCWLAGAVGLSSRNRLAWCASLLGVGLMFSAAVTMFAVGLRLMPIAQDSTDGIGYMLILGVLGLLFSTPVLIGLFLLRRQWIRSERTIAEPGASPNCGPATQLGHSGVAEGPQSVS
jgi:hypothetical protein